MALPAGIALAPAVRDLAMIAAIERRIGPITLSARPARVAEAAAELRVAVPAAGRLTPLRWGRDSSAWADFALTRGRRRCEDQRERRGDAYQPHQHSFCVS